MNQILLATKFFVPPSRHKAVDRTDLCRRLNEGLLVDAGFSRKLTLISAPPGSGKSTLASEWLRTLDAGKAWLSLDEKDGDPSRFLAYLVSALQTAEPGLGTWVLEALQVPQGPSIETLLVMLINEIAGLGSRIILVLDDYHAINAPHIDDIMDFLIDSLPPRLHLVIITREDPGLPLARYRARGQICELRASDLRFSHADAMDYFGRVMDIKLDEADVDALEERTEGWVAGLQFAALALQGEGHYRTKAEFIASFKGSHRFVLDYLIEEVLLQRSEETQTFLLSTSCLGRFCGALCDAIMESPAGTGRATLEGLDRANLFLVPLDEERRWYRYHHLFADLLQLRLSTSPRPACPPPTVIHARASAWFEQNDLILEAFRHAAASGNVARAEELIEDRRMPTHSRVAMSEVIDWLTGLPDTMKNQRPSLWVKLAGHSLFFGQSTGVEKHLAKAESAIRGREGTERLLLGQIATARSTLKISQYRIDEAKRHSLRALEYLEPYDVAFSVAALWNMGIAHHLAGEEAEAKQLLEQVLSVSHASGNVNFQILAELGLGEIQESDNQLFNAEETFRRVLALAGEHPQPNICVAYQGLARIHYEWNDLDEATLFAERGLSLARQYDGTIDMSVACDVLIARLETARGKLESAEKRLGQAGQVALSNGFMHRLPEIRAAQALLLLRRGSIPDVADVPTPIRIRTLLAQQQCEEAAALANSWAAEAPSRSDVRLRALVLRAIAQASSDSLEAALTSLDEALALAEAGGFIQVFVDLGPVMRRLVNALHDKGRRTEYTNRILRAFQEQDSFKGSQGSEAASTGHEILTDREKEVLLEIAAGLSNQDIADKLFISLFTVKVHVRNIFSKLEASSRTSALATARSIGIIS